MAKLGRDTIFKLVGGEIHMQFKGSGFDTMSRAIDHYRTAAKDFRPAFKAFDPIMKRSIQINFAQEGRPQRWQALAEKTEDDREAKGYPRAHPILERTGKLKRGFYSRIGPRSYAIHNRVPYFPYHQHGTNKMPARPMVVILDGLERRFTELARKHLTEF